MGISITVLGLLFKIAYLTHARTQKNFSLVLLSAKLSLSFSG
ncbi:hypothetical protein K661_02166 [Piscirickettsia salmonis LF-89 = ATCC VR-1361]|nr:hypothetical protein K661_02166 [Piscirickettsia salmonis LF-89 = ATCC VR-1361]